MCHCQAGNRTNFAKMQKTSRVARAHEVSRSMQSCCCCCSMQSCCCWPSCCCCLMQCSCCCCWPSCWPSCSLQSFFFCFCFWPGRKSGNQLGADLLLLLLLLLLLAILLDADLLLLLAITLPSAAAALLHLASSSTAMLDRTGRARCDDSLCAGCQTHRCTARALDHVYAKCYISYSGTPV